MPRKVIAWLLAGALAGATGALAQSPQQDPFKLRSLPGFVDARELGMTLGDGDLTVEVNLEGPILAFIAEASRAADPELADALGRLKTVRARIYQVAEGGLAAARRKTEAAARRLDGKGWQRVVTLREDDAQTYLYFKTESGRILGLIALFVSDESQLGFINIAGEVDPAQIGRIAKKLQIEALEEPLEEVEEPPR